MPYIITTCLLYVPAYMLYYYNELLVLIGFRTAAALRTSMMASLLTLLDNSLLSISSVEDFMERLLPQVLSCLDDSNESTRKMSCQALSYLIPAMNGEC